LVASYRFDESAGALVVDQTANHNDGVLGGYDATAQPTRTAAGAPGLGAGLTVDGGNDRGTVPASPSLKPSQVSVGAWVKFSNLDSPNAAAPGLQYIVFKQNTRTGNFEGYTLCKLRVNGVDRLFFAVSSASGVPAVAMSTMAVVTGQYYNVYG